MRIPKVLLKKMEFRNGDNIPAGSIVYMISEILPWVDPPTVNIDAGKFETPCLLSDLGELPERCCCLR
jgi:hypothetical protein